MYDLSNITPGEDVTLSLTVPNMTAGTTVSTASMKIKAAQGDASVLLALNISTTLSASGQVVDPDAGGSALLKFILTDTQTNTLYAALTKYKPYLVFSVELLNNAGDIIFTVPMGRIIFNLKA